MDTKIHMEEKPNIDWNNMVAVAPGFWAPRSKKWDEDNMGRLQIHDATPEEQAEADANAALERLTETEKKAAAQRPAKVMPDDVKEKLRLLNQERKAKKAAIKAQFGPETPKKLKVPVFQDLEKQAEACKKYPWAVANSFVQDPEKSGGTLLAIKCQICADERIIHLADLFHTKLCKPCKKNDKKPAKVGKQPTSGPSGEQGPGVDTK